MRLVRRTTSFAYLLLFSICAAFLRFIIPAIEEIISNNSQYTYKELYHLPLNVSYNETTKFCDSDVFLVTMVMTQHKNFLQRVAIRNSWGGVKQVFGKKIHHIFVLAETDDLALRESAQRENDIFKDMVCLNFKDSYLNLTYKTVQSLQLVTKYCPRVDYVLKADDDVFVNYFSLATFLIGKPRTNFAVGHKFPKAIPIRWRKSKWYTSRKVYPSRVYPPYLAGTAYVMSRDVAYRVHLRGAEVTFLPWEDVFVGMCLKKIRVTPAMDRRFDTYSVEYKRNVTCPLHRVFAVHNMDPKNITLMWNKYIQEDQDPRCSPYMELVTQP